MAKRSARRAVKLVNLKGAAKPRTVRLGRSGAGVGERRYLYLNGVASRDLVLAFASSKKVERQKKIIEGTRTEKLLPAIMAFVGKHIPNGIIVAQGGGSFTPHHAENYVWHTKDSNGSKFIKGNLVKPSLTWRGAGFTQVRLVVAIANALAYAWGIRIAVVPVDVELEKIPTRIKSLRWTNLALPHYRGPGVG